MARPGAVVGIWLLAFFGIVGMVVAIVVTLVAAVIGAAFLDLTTLGSRRGVRDQNAANFYAPIDNQTWQVPTSYIDHRTGGGPPPGDKYEEDDVEEMAGDRPALANRDDPAP